MEAEKTGEQASEAQVKPFAVATVVEETRRRPVTIIPPAALIWSTLLVLASMFVAYLAYQLFPVLFLLLLAILFATAIEPLVNRLRHGPFSRTQGILVVYTGIVLIIVALAWLVVPVFAAQVGRVVEDMPKWADQINAWADSSNSPFLSQQAAHLASALRGVFQQSGTPTAPPDQQLNSVTTTALAAGESIFSVLAVFVVAFYWLTERTRIKRYFISLLPADRGNRVRRVWDDIEVKVGGWVRGQLTLMMIVGLASAVGYFLIGVSYWPALALIIAICEAIPLVGPYIGTAPALLMALTQTGSDGLPALLGMGDMGGLTRAILIVVFAVILQTVEGNVLIPRVMRNSVGISPLTVMVSILVGAALAGLAGALLAVPVAGALQVIFADLRAAAQSDRELAAATAEAEETRREDAELVVAKDGPNGSTLTEVQGQL